MNTESAVCGLCTQVNQADEATTHELTVDLGALVRAAVDRSRYEHKAIAYDLGYQGDYWSRVLSSERGITLDRLGRLPVEIQRVLVAQWALALGLTLERRGGDADMQTLSALIVQRRVRITIEGLR